MEKINPAGIPMAVICWICAAVFLGIGSWAAHRRDPMHFWAGTTVTPEEIRDIPAYNRACSRMWRVYGAVYVLAGAAALVSAGCAGVMIALACVVGLPLLILWYQKIYRRYKR
ncbi:MAG: hypothetical protein ACI3XZ_02785 [Butyricicoccus sp.]